MTDVDLAALDRVLPAISIDRVGAASYISR
jgi:hypothetical protein